MTFANTEMKRFKDLTPEQRSEIVEAWLKGNTEHYYKDEDIWRFNISLFYSSVYRVKPLKPSPKLDIPWHLFKHEWKWAAKDEDGEIYIFTSEPECDYSTWCSSGNNSKINSINHNFEPDGEVDWKQSLIERPVGE